MARMARTGLVAEVASRTAGEQTQWVSFHSDSASLGTMTGAEDGETGRVWCALVTYIESPHDPRAGSYKPPRTGFSRVSKVVSFSIFLTDTAWISSLVRNVNSTRSTEDDTGWEMFMVVGCDGTGVTAAP